MVFLHTNSYESPPIADERQQWESAQRDCGSVHLSIERVFMNGVEIGAKISNSLLYTYLLFLQSDCKIL